MSAAKIPSAETYAIDVVLTIENIGVIELLAGEESVEEEESDGGDDRMADGKPRSVDSTGEIGDDEDVEDEEEDEWGSGSVKGPSKWIRCAGMTRGSSLVGTAAELTVASEDRILAAILGACVCWRCLLSSCGARWLRNRGLFYVWGR